MGIAVVIILQIFRPNAMKHISTFLPLMVSFMMSACVYGGSTELSGELVQQHHSLDAFNSIHVKTGVQLILTQGETYAAMVEADLPMQAAEHTLRLLILLLWAVLQKPAVAPM